jgi:outer membrane immunogenic protein
MKSRLLLAAALLAAGSIPVMAADLAPQPVEPVAPVYVPYSWTGFYIGLHAGVVGSDSKATNLLSGFAAKFDDTGFIGGAHAGYNYQFPQGFVIGLEGDIDYTSLSKTQTFAGPTFSESDRFKSDWQGSIRARAGYAFDRVLPYITGGVAFANQKFTVSGFDTVLGPYGGSNSTTRTGWTLGAGVEYAMTDNILIRLEGRYSDFGKKNYQFAGSAPIKVRFHEWAGTLGVSYKFSSADWF